MANTYLTIEMIGYTMLPVLHNNLIAGKKVSRKYESQFAKQGAKIGAQFMVRKPPTWVVTKGAAFQGQDYTDSQVTLTVDQHDQIGVEFNNDDFTLSVDDFADRVLGTQLVPMANSVDVFIMSKFQQVWNTTGIPGTTAATDTPFLDAKTLLTNNAINMADELPMLTTPRVSARLSSGLAGRFNPTDAIGRLYDKGAMGDGLGWHFYQSQNMPTQVTGNFAGTPVVSTSATQTGSSITTNGWTATTSTVLIGDTFQLTNVFQLNPVTKANNGELQWFTATANSTADGGGAMTINFAPPIVLTGPQATVSASPAIGASVLMYGQANVALVANQTSPTCLGWSEDGITLAMVDLAMPGKNQGVEAVRVSDDDLGLSFLFMRGYDIRGFANISRVDDLYGTVYTRPEHIVRTQA